VVEGGDSVVVGDSVALYFSVVAMDAMGVLSTSDSSKFNISDISSSTITVFVGKDVVFVSMDIVFVGMDVVFVGMDVV